MDELIPILTSLAEQISGDITELRINSPSLWPFVKQLTEAQLDYLIEDYFGWPKELAVGFTDEKQYKTSLSPQMSGITGSSIRQYWMFYSKDQCLVGNLNISIKQNENMLVFAIGFGTFPEYRRRGFAFDSVKAVSDYILQQSAVPYVVAESELDNEYSIKLLLRNGFRDYAAGVCTTSGLGIFSGVEMRRFLKTSGQPPKNWPLSPSSPILGSGS